MMKSIRKYLSNFRYNAWVLEGPERHSNANLRLLYVGGNDQNKNYIANLVFNSSFQENFLGRFWLFRPLSFKHKLSGKNHMVITEIKKRHTGNAKNLSFFIPCWIDGKINIQKTLRLTETSENLKSDLRRIRKLQYTYEVVREREKFVDFYNNMYVPYIKNIYGNEALYHSLDGILKRFEQSELLLIKEGQLPVTGEVIIYGNHGPKLLCLGVQNGDRQYVNAGAIAALYYFRLLHLKSKGYSDIDLGSSRGFLSDGVLNYKKKWGMHLTALRGSGFMIHQIALTTGTKSFLINNPFINTEPDGFSSVYFYDRNTTLTKKQQKKIINAFAANGVNKLLVCQLDAGFPPMTITENSPVPIEMRRINSQQNRFLSVD